MSDAWFSVLSSYDGTVNDRKKAYFVSVEGYTENETVQDMEFKKLGSLGYSGGLNDRWKKYLISLGGDGTLSDMNNQTLLALTFYAGVSGSDSLLIEIGDFILLENGDKLLLE